MHDVAQRAGKFSVERPAGDERETASIRVRIDAGGVPAHHRGAGDAKAEMPAVAPRDLDLVAGRDFAEEGEVGIAVAGIDRGPQ